MDGIDVACIHTDGVSGVKRGANGFYPYSAETRKLLAQALDDAKFVKNRDDRPGVLNNVEDTIDMLHCEAVRDFLSQNNMQADDVNVIGYHGQTVLHRPDDALTVQLGQGQVLANELGINVVSDMRAEDMRNGGQGAPLVPVYHQALVASLPSSYDAKLPVVFVNIGGISNVTYVGEELIAFDSGPGNALIDQWVQAHVGIPYDQGGVIASEGQVRIDLAKEMLAAPYFEAPLPKSLDRSDFRLPSSDWANVEDGARTLAYVCAGAVIKCTDYLPKAPRLWIICGGGRLNPHIMNDLAELAAQSGSQVVSADDVGLDGDSMEAEAWGYLAVRSIAQLPLTFPGTTGCKHPVTGGILSRAR